MSDYYYYFIHVKLINYYRIIIIMCTLYLKGGVRWYYAIQLAHFKIFTDAVQFKISTNILLRPSMFLSICTILFEVYDVGATMIKLKWNSAGYVARQSTQLVDESCSMGQQYQKYRGLIDQIKPVRAAYNRAAYVQQWAVTE